jgi:ABC-type nickel/cobalt efflux system permease component RcnA
MKGVTLLILGIALLLIFVSVDAGRRKDSSHSKSRSHSDSHSHSKSRSRSDSKSDEHSSAKRCSVNKCNNPKVRYYADPADHSCRHFCECAHGIPYRLACHEPLLFNPKINVCDWPNKVHCGGKRTRQNIYSAGTFL